jgi:exonuclease SbcD
MGAVFAGMARAFRSDRVNVLLAHAMIDGARIGGGEQELTIGMTYAISPARIPGTASYVALGHLHRPQAVPSAPSPTRFAGSLLQLDFGETDQDKSVVLVEAKAGRPPRARKLPVSAGRKLLDLRGPLDQVLARAPDLGDAYLRVFVETDGPVPGLADRVREALPGAVWVEPVYERREAAQPEAGMRTLQPREQFLHYFRHAHGAEPEEALMEAFDRVHAEVAEGAA